MMHARGSWLLIGVGAIGLLLLAAVGGHAPPGTTTTCQPSHCPVYYCTSRDCGATQFATKEEPVCGGEPRYYVNGDKVSKQRFRTEVQSMNQSCNGCVRTVPVPCR